MEPSHVLLVDDHVLFRKGLGELLSSRKEFTVIGEASDGVEAIAAARRLVPDIVLMDIYMPRCTGLEATRHIKTESPATKIVILTVSDDDHNLFAAIQDGASGYLLKDMEPHQLYDMLNLVRQGEAAIPGTMALRILQEFARGKEPPAPQPGELSCREIEVLELVVQGASNKEIADALDITENTVKIHLRNILEKLHLRNRIQAAVYAVRNELVSGMGATDHTMQ